MTIYQAGAKPEDRIFGIRPIEDLFMHVRDGIEAKATSTSVVPNYSDPLYRRLMEGIAGLAPMPKESERIHATDKAAYERRINAFLRL